MKHFKLSEFDCKETGENKMCPSFLCRLDVLRDLCGFSFIITSGYRSKRHSAEKNKDKGGTHTQGIAADIYCSNAAERLKIVSTAIEQGFTGIGVAKNFVHVDTRETTPVMWVYD